MERESEDALKGLVSITVLLAIIYFGVQSGMPSTPKKVKKFLMCAQIGNFVVKPRDIIEFSDGGLVVVNRIESEVIDGNEVHTILLSDSSDLAIGQSNELNRIKEVTNTMNVRYADRVKLYEEQQRDKNETIQLLTVVGGWILFGVVSLLVNRKKGR